LLSIGWVASAVKQKASKTMIDNAFKYLIASQILRGLSRPFGQLRMADISSLMGLEIDS
jgi:hypothetical protein